MVIYNPRASFFRCAFVLISTGVHVLSNTLLVRYVTSCHVDTHCHDHETYHYMLHNVKQLLGAGVRG